MKPLLKQLLNNSLKQSLSDYVNQPGNNLKLRGEFFYHWQDERRKNDVWPYSRTLFESPKAETSICDDKGERKSGINFASQDYLSLSTNPSVQEAVIKCIRDFGLHSAGSSCLLGNTSLSLKLEQTLSEFLEMEHIVLFPTGWGAGYGAITALVRPYDYIIMDKLSHACLHQGAHSATGNIFRHAHLKSDAVRDYLKSIRKNDRKNGILVITEGLFSMDSDVPDIKKLQDYCHEYNATLMVDGAHDLGSMGLDGTDSIGIQNMLGKVDLVMGSFSKSFASNGGFLATNSASLKQYVKFYGSTHIFSNALSPVQTTTVLEAIKIIRSYEGKVLRERLMNTVLALREEFDTHTIPCKGIPSPIVPVMIGDEAVARIASSLIFQRSVFANLVEYPAVAPHDARFRLQAMAAHTTDHARKAAKIISEAIIEAKKRNSDKKIVTK